MKNRLGFMAGVVVVASIGGGEASAIDQLKKDRTKMALDAGGIAVNVLLFNPGGVALGTTMLGVHTFQYRKHKGAAQVGVGSGTAAVAATTPVPAALQPAATGSLVAIPDRPGYFYDSANPNQLYVDPSVASQPMQARIAEPARIEVQIANTARDGRTIHYSVSGTPYSVPPGFTQNLQAPEGSIISYDRGGDAGSERFKLASGPYEFRTVDQGWRFYATGATPTGVAKAMTATMPTESARPPATVR